MFLRSQHLYDLIYSKIKDYPNDAATIARLVRERLPEAREILDVACGTGEHARLLAEEHGFSVDGVDLDQGMLEIARAKNPAGRYHHASMIDFDLGRRYDALLCLFSSIGYVITLDNVERTLATFARHLRDGGVLIVEPWLTPDAIEDGRVTAWTFEGEGVTATRMTHMRVDGTVSRFNFQYLVGERGGITHLSEVHECGLFTVDEMTRAFERTGFDVEYDPKGPMGRGIYLAQLRGGEVAR